MNRTLVAAAIALLSISTFANVANAMGYIDMGDYSKKGTGSEPNSVPELAIGAGTGAFVIIAGAALIVAGRRRRSQKR